MLYFYILSYLLVKTLYQTKERRLRIVVCSFSFFCILQCAKTMEKVLEKLSDLILMEMGKTGRTQTCFAELCGISRNELRNIIAKRKNDIKLSTIQKICENSSINYIDVFYPILQNRISKEEIFSEITIFIRNEKYKLAK